MTSCGSIIIEGCFYSIKLTYTNTDGTAATLNPDAKQMEQVKAKVQEVVTALQAQLTTDSPTKPLSSYNTLQLNSAGVQLDSDHKEWTTLTSVKTVWDKVCKNEGESKGLLALCITMRAVKGTGPINKDDREETLTATLTVGSSPSLVATAPTVARVDPETDAAAAPKEFDFDQAAENILETTTIGGTTGFPTSETVENKIKFIYDAAFRQEALQEIKQKLKLFLITVNKAIEKKILNSTAETRENVLIKLNGLTTENSDNPSSSTSFLSIIRKLTNFIGGNSTPTKANPINANAIAGVIENIKDNLTHLYSKTNTPPTATDITNLTMTIGV
jgi:hypothetical protein